MFQFLILMIFSLKLTARSEIIYWIIYETKEAPEAYIEPCQTSTNNFFANFFSNVILVVWRKTYFH